MRVFKLSSIYKNRFFLINLSVLLSLFFVIIKNIDSIRFTKISNENGETFILDRFTSEIRKN